MILGARKDAKRLLGFASISLVDPGLGRERLSLEPDGRRELLTPDQQLTVEHDVRDDGREDAAGRKERDRLQPADRQGTEQRRPAPPLPGPRADSLRPSHHPHTRADKYFVLLPDGIASVYIVNVDGQRQVFLTQYRSATSDEDLR